MLIVLPFYYTLFSSLRCCYLPPINYTIEIIKTHRSDILMFFRHGISFSFIVIVLNNHSQYANQFFSYPFNEHLKPNNVSLKRIRLAYLILFCSEFKSPLDQKFIGLHQHNSQQRDITDIFLIRMCPASTTKNSVLQLSSLIVIDLGAVLNDTYFGLVKFSPLKR